MCLLNEVHHIIDGPGKSSKGLAHFKKPARFYEAQAQRLFWSINNRVVPISPYTSHTPILDPQSQSWIFFTDGTYSRNLELTTPHNNGSGFLAAYDDIHSVRGFEMSFTSTSYIKQKSWPFLH